MNQKQKKAIRDFVDYIVTPIAIALLVIFYVFAASKAWGMGVFERYGIAATRDDITEAVDPIARQVASNETAIASHATQLESLGNLAYLDTLAASDVGAYSTSKVDELLDGKLGNSGSQTIKNGSLTVNGDISLGGSGTRKFMFNSTCGMYYDVRGGWAKGITISNGQGTDVFIPLNDGEENTAALWTDVIAAVQQIAPAWVSGTAYTANALVTYYDVVYRCKADTVSPHTATPDADTTHWEAKPVSELFLPLMGGELEGVLTLANQDNYPGFGLLTLKSTDRSVSINIGLQNDGRIVLYGGGGGCFLPKLTLENLWRTLALAAPSPTADNLAALDASGNPTDSGIPKSDVITTSSAAWIDITNRLHQLEMQM